MGVEHGLGAIEQGAKVPPGLVFRSWPDAAAFDALDGEPALTLIPNLVLTGALAVVISMAIGVWTVWGVRHPRWGRGLVGLSVVLLLRGGFGPPVIGLVVGLLAIRARLPLSTPARPAARVVARLWPWPLVMGVTSFVLLFPGSRSSTPQRARSCRKWSGC